MASIVALLRRRAVPGEVTLIGVVVWMAMSSAVSGRHDRLGGLTGLPGAALLADYRVAQELLPDSLIERLNRESCPYQRSRTQDQDGTPDMTDQMKAVVLARFGGVDGFELRDVPVPPVKARQVRVRVHATAINPLDYQIRRGDYADDVSLPAIIGHDISGVIQQVGTDVTEFRVGDAVYYTPRIFGGPGSYAEQHVADVELVGRKPENLSHLEAASLTLVGGTVWEALVTRAELTAGETILIHGGAGGVGTVAIQVAKAIGARVITTARAGDHEFLRSLGADIAIDFTSTDYVDAVAEMTQGKGVQVVFDTIGGDTLTRSPLTLAELGRVVSIVDVAQPQNLIEAWATNAAYHFVFTRQNRGKLDALTTLVEQGLVKPVIGATLPLARIGEAHDLLENRRSYALRGKVAIDVVGKTVALPPRTS